MSREGSSPTFAISIDELKALASAQAAAIARWCLPNGREDGPYWRSGSIADEPGQSLAVTLQGADQGMWCDHAASGPEGGGNILQLIAWTRYGGSIKDAIAAAISFLGLDGMDPGRLATVRAEARAKAARSADAGERQREDRRRSALGLYLRGLPIADTPAENYLKGRGIDLRAMGHAPRCLAFSPNVYNVEAGRELPCMLAAVVDLDGRHIATHRTWLAPDAWGGWGKADLAAPKMALGGFGGGFIPLWKGACRKPMKDLDAGTAVLVSEGIEDGLTAAAARPESRVIAAISLGNIGKLRLPEQIGPLVILAQRDAPGSKAVDALERAIAELQERGIDVRLAMPPVGVKDVNELVRAA
jgi:hypothetical protein